MVAGSSLLRLFVEKFEFKSKSNLENLNVVFHLVLYFSKKYLCVCVGGFEAKVEILSISYCGQKPHLGFLLSAKNNLKPYSPPLHPESCQQLCIY